MNTHDKQSDSLLAALSKVKIPVENHGFIRQFISAMGTTDFIAVPRDDKPYIRAVRRDGLADLHIFYGYTTGFTSEDEIIRLAGNGAERAPSSGKGTRGTSW